MFNTKIISLNIETTDIRCLITKGNQIVSWATIPLEPNLVKEGLVIDLTAVSNTINQLTAEHKVKGQNIIAALSGFQSVHRLIELPKMARKLMEEAISRQATRTMPVPLEQLYLSWYATEENKNPQQVFLLGIPRNLMDTEVQCLRLSGLTPKNMDLKPLALARMVNRSEALIIDIELESSDIIVVWEERQPLCAA